MRRLVILLAACGGSPRPAPAPIANTPAPAPHDNCVEAATGLERATKSVRDPESSVLEDMRLHCVDDAWPREATECFTSMAEGDLSICARKLDEHQRERMLGVFSGGSDREQIAVARVRLENLHVGVAECDRFVSRVHALLDCETMPIQDRVTLGTETADFWFLPKSGLPPAVQQRMATACGTSLASLEQQASTVGCMP